jgi:hypothetical protein
MEHAGARTRGTQATGNLQLASGVRGGDNLRRGPGDVPYLTVEQRGRLFRLRDVVDPRARAAPARLRQILERNSGNQPQQRARLANDPLPVREVT